MRRDAPPTTPPANFCGKDVSVTVDTKSHDTAKPGVQSRKCWFDGTIEMSQQIYSDYMKQLEGLQGPLM